MIICNTKKFIYVHIPKCGGTTVSTVFESNLLPQDITLNLNPHKGWQKYIDVYQEKYGLHKHSTPGEIELAMKHEYFSQYFIFTFCRNPFARAYSAYTFTLKSDAIYRPNSTRYNEIKNMNFDQFISSRYVQNKEILPTMPQSKWLFSGGKVIHFFKLENINFELPRLVNKLWGKDMQSVPITNYSSSQDEWKKMSKRSENAIRELYADDFHILGYSNAIER